MNKDNFISDVQDFQNWQNLVSKVVKGKTVLFLPIRDADGHQVGFLSPITFSSVNDDVLIKSMTTWRNHASKYFFTQFEATTARTKDWLERVVLSDMARLLFLIHSNSRLIGHFGFKNLSANSAEIDNLVRGERGGHPQLIHFAEVALLRWLFLTFPIKSLYGYVLDRNFQAIELHSRVGFKNLERVPLSGRVVNKLGLIGQLDSDRHESSNELYSQKIILHRREFHMKGYIE